MALSSSIAIWKNIEGLEKTEQKKLLQWQLQAREPIHSFADIRTGDHLVRKGTFLGGLIPYEHHFLCIGFNDKGMPKIVHYFNTLWNAVKQLIPTCLDLGSALEQLGTVQEMTLPHKDFIKSEEELQTKGSEVERVVWPDELRRFSVEEVTENAKKRKGEKWYNVVKNNCETFVMWCLCGLEISTQMNRVIRAMCEVGSTVIKMVRQPFQQVPKACVEFADDIIALMPQAAAANVPRNVLPKGAGLAVGSATSIVVEMYQAYCDIRDAKEKWDKRVVIKERKDFIKQVIDSVVSAPLRTTGSVTGLIAGQILIPIPVLGGIIGAAVGVFAGDFSSKLLTEFDFTEWLADCIDDYIAKQKRE